MKNKITAVLGAAALTAALLPTSVFAYWTGGYEVIIDGVGVANVKSADKVTQMVEAVNNQLTAAYGPEAVIEPEIELKAKILASQKLTDDRKLHDAIASVSELTTEAIRITVDGKETVCVQDNEALTAAVTAIIDRNGIAGAKSEIIELIGCIPEVLPETDVYSAEDAADFLIEYGLVNVKSSVSAAAAAKYVPEAEQVSNPELYEGVSEVFYSGRDGEQTVTETSYYLNGEYVGTKSTSEITDYGEPAKVYVGTKERPDGVGTGSFIMPTSGKITSLYGERWGSMHNGIDIGAPAGTPVYASDDGVVTCAENKNSYGKLVKIDHGNGYETYYAHNSELLVSAGETVSKGQLIARVGATGNATGPHCHFEIRYNGEIKNPSNYVE